MSWVPQMKRTEAHAVAPVVVRSLCGIDQPLVVAKAKIVVRAHADDFPCHPPALRGRPWAEAIGASP